MRRMSQPVQQPAKVVPRSAADPVHGGPGAASGEALLQPAAAWLGLQAQQISGWHQGPVLEQQAKQLRAWRLAGRGETIQRVLGFDEMRTSLVNGSDDRKSNQAYLSIVADLATAQASEAVAVTSADYVALAQAVADMLGQIPQAGSTHWKKGTARNTALRTLRAALLNKQALLNRRAAALARVATGRMAAPSAGRKAGFEMESSAVWAVDLAKCSAWQRSQLEQGNFMLRKPHFGKRDPLIGAPEGTWEAQADSTLEFASNLEVVTRAMTAAEWQAPEAGQDQDALKKFVEALKAAPTKALLVPTELEPSITMHHPGLRLWKKDAAAFQGQMTSAHRLPEPQTGEPRWWLTGMNWAAVACVKDIARALLSSGVGVGVNPKEAFGGAILKTPVLDVLGSPDERPTASEKKAWVEGMAAECSVKDLASEVAQSLVAESRKDKRRSAFWLNPTGFTWGDYLSGLLDNMDLVTDWASSAFDAQGGSSEDIGLGQIRDNTLPEGYVIKEQRFYADGRGPQPEDYVHRAIAWAQQAAED